MTAADSSASLSIEVHRAGIPFQQYRDECSFFQFAAAGAQRSHDNAQPRNDYCNGAFAGSCDRSPIHLDRDVLVVAFKRPVAAEAGGTENDRVLRQVCWSLELRSPFEVRL